MKGIVIFAHSKCRSTFALYRELAKLVPVRMVAREGVLDYRRDQGVCDEEFTGLACEIVGEDWKRASEILEETKGWMYLVAAYQVSPVFRRVALEAKARGNIVGIISEEPWCSFDIGADSRWKVKVALWNIYLRTILKWRVGRVVKTADFFINYSGDGIWNAETIGWKKNKIIPFGYWPEKITRGCGGEKGKDVRVLVPATKGRPGRGEEVVRSAFRNLSDRSNISLSIPDVVSDSEIRSLYETSDIMIAAGYNEPWGIRVNDALNAGLPCVVSSGMGSAKMIRETGAGEVFERGNPDSLSAAFLKVLSDLPRYQAAARDASDKISPATKARELLEKVVEK